MATGIKVIRAGEIFLKKYFWRVIGSPSSEEVLPLKQEKVGQLGHLGQNKGNIQETPYARDSKENFREQTSAASQMSQNDLWSGMPESPTASCYACGGTDFWPDFKNKRWICSRCHPKVDMKV